MTDATPRWLLLDEPTANLDVAHGVTLLQSLADRAGAGDGVLAVLHDLDLAARFADRVALLAGGELIALGELNAILATTDSPLDTSHMDRRLLSAVIEKFDGGPVGVDSLAAAIGEERGTIEDVLEPYLIQQGFLMRTPRGRMATRACFISSRMARVQRSSRSLRSAYRGIPQDLVTDLQARKYRHHVATGLTDAHQPELLLPLGTLDLDMRALDVDVDACGDGDGQLADS